MLIALRVLTRDGWLLFFTRCTRLFAHGALALACWDCSKNRIDELRLQILPGPGEPKFDAPGAFLFLNWVQSGFAKLGN